MKNRMYLMIFYADGRSRNFGFELISTVKTVLTVLAVLAVAGSCTIAYNYYKLGHVKSSHAQTIRNLSQEQLALKEKLTRLEHFEEQISYYLGGALKEEENNGVPIDYSGGIGGGAELDMESANSMESLSAEVDVAIPVIDRRAEKTEDRIRHLKQRLTELTDLAFQEKKRLDYTPSIMPTQGYMTSRFGWRKSPFTGKRHFHRGVDIVNKIGTPVRATAWGTVVFAGKEQYWGNCVFVEHRDGIISKYGHLSGFKVKKGEDVSRGDVIGQVGMSGRTTGPHLHYQIEIGDKAIDPLKFVIEESTD